MTTPRRRHHQLFKTPKETINAIAIAASKKGELRLDSLCVLGFLAGVWVAFGGFALMSVAGGTEATYGKGMAKFLGSLVFPVALMMVVTAGAELYTGNTMVFAVGLADRKVTILALARNWAVVWALNFCGSMAAAYFLGYLTEMYSTDPWLSYVRALTVAKVTRGWGAQVLRGVAANILVVSCGVCAGRGSASVTDWVRQCMATLISTASEDIASKFLSCLFFIGTFVLVGFEHSIANMSLLTTGLLYGAPTTIHDVMVNNIIPVTIGNTIGGAFLGISQWYCFQFALPGQPVQGVTAWRNVASRLVLGETKAAPNKKKSNPTLLGAAWESSSTTVPLTTITK